MNNISAYPLCWPMGWPRTEAVKRERGLFKTTLPAALGNLRRQLNLMGTRELTISSNCTLGMDNPKEPGVVAYFKWNALSVAIPCDRWSRIEHNVQAIALTVEAMRGMERWGAKHMIEAMFTGFKALPAGDTEWWSVLGLPKGASASQVKEAYRLLAKKHHPDAGGNADEFKRLTAAYERAQLEAA